jgi:hypothetical protein
LWLGERFLLDIENHRLWAWLMDCLNRAGRRAALEFNQAMAVCWPPLKRIVKQTEQILEV